MGLFSNNDKRWGANMDTVFGESNVYDGKYAKNLAKKAAYQLKQEQKAAELKAAQDAQKAQRKADAKRIKEAKAAEAKAIAKAKKNGQAPPAKKKSGWL